MAFEELAGPSSLIFVFRFNMHHCSIIASPKQICQTPDLTDIETCTAKHLPSDPEDVTPWSY